MSETESAGHDHSEPAHPDEVDSGGGHDDTERSSGAPYVPPGRDSAGNPRPSVPHEGLLGRIGVAVIGGQSVVLLAVAVAGFVVSRHDGFLDQPDNSVLALRLNGAHSTLLLVTALAGFAVLRWRYALRRYAAIQAIVYFLVFAFGAAYSANSASATFLDINTPDSVLHGVVAVIGFVTLMITAARVVEPPPGSLPYPEVTHDDQSSESAEDSGSSAGRRNSS